MGMISNFAKVAVLSALGVTMIGGATYALFNANTTPMQHSFVAGTVKIEEPYGFFWWGQKHFSNLEPGDSGFGTICFQNTGSLDAWVSLESLLLGGKRDIFASYPNDHHPLKIDCGIELLNATGIPISNPYANGDSQTNDLPVVYYVNGINQILLQERKNPQVSTFFLPAHDSALVVYKWWFPLAAANAYQATSGTLMIKANAIQASNNIAIKRGIGIAPQTFPATTTS